MADPAIWSSGIFYIIAALVFGYILGSIPFGLIITRFAGLGDVRSIGSGNIGATNVLRTGRKGLAAATLFADMAKGLAAVLLTGMYDTNLAVAAGLGTFLGHCFPVWLNFKGGKGVATYVGILIGLAFKAALVFAVVWLAVAAVTRYSSLAALLASICCTIALFWLGENQSAQLFVLLTVLVWIFHRQNISRLLSGNEGKIGSKG